MSQQHRFHREEGLRIGIVPKPGGEIPEPNTLMLIWCRRRTDGLRGEATCPSGCLNICGRGLADDRELLSALVIAIENPKLGPSPAFAGLF